MYETRCIPCASVLCHLLYYTIPMDLGQGFPLSFCAFSPIYDTFLHVFETFLQYKSVKVLHLQIPQKTS